MSNVTTGIVILIFGLGFAPFLHLILVPIIQAAGEDASSVPIVVIAYVIAVIGIGILLIGKPENGYNSRKR